MSKKFSVFTIAASLAMATAAWAKNDSEAVTQILNDPAVSGAIGSANILKIENLKIGSVGRTGEGFSITYRTYSFKKGLLDCTLVADYKTTCAPCHGQQCPCGGSVSFDPTKTMCFAR